MASPRDLPSLDRLLGQARLAGRPRALTVAAGRRALAAARAAVLAGGPVPDVDTLTQRIADDLGAADRPRLRAVVNATGIVIQTNLGRAPISAAAAAAMAAVAAGYSNLEYDLDRGERGSRATHLEPLLTELTGAEGALAVNNNAAALLLALAALAREREVVISRGQLVEIGGGFRIPDVMRQSGAELVEVGTTNRTYARDYAEAIGARTAALLRVHSSNFRVVGFTHEPALSELVEVARQRDLLVIDDLGSGSLLDTAAHGLAHEPTVQESVSAGSDVVCFSGDKLLGGPQAGILVGRHRAIDQLKRHPLARAVRLDKASIAGLEATLQHYRRDEAAVEIPVWRMIATPLEALQRRASDWAVALSGSAALEGVVEPSCSAVGGGSLPGETLPTCVLALRARDRSADELAARLRGLDPPLVARIERERVLLDPRTVLPEQDTTVKEHLLSLARGTST
jgi:L-seryl-tRNA(Ser) seleniumtransferase